MSTVTWRSVVVDGEAMVSIADILEWLRTAETAWTGSRSDDPARVAAFLADELRDVWLAGTDTFGGGS